jgi:Fe-Mn family superoxide dismutase
LSPEKQEIPENLKNQIENDFGSLENFQQEFLNAAKTLFGSG